MKRRALVKKIRLHSFSVPSADINWTLVLPGHQSYLDIVLPRSSLSLISGPILLFELPLGPFTMKIVVKTLQQHTFTIEIEPEKTVSHFFLTFF